MAEMEDRWLSVDERVKAGGAADKSRQDQAE